MADTLDVITLAEGRAAIGQDRSTVDSDLDTELELYITSTSRWLDSVCGPVVSRAVVTCDTNTSVTTLALSGADENALKNLTEGEYVDIGTAADPTAVAADRQVLEVDRDNLTVRIDGASVTTTTSHTIRQGRFVDTDNVDSDVKVAAQMYLRWLWAVERGAASRNFDDITAVGETLAVPRRVLDHLSDYFRPGIG